MYALCQGPGEGDFFSSGADGMVVLWNLNNPEQGKVVAKVQGSVYALLYIPEKNRLLIAVNQDGFHLLDVESGKEVWQFPTPDLNTYRLVKLGANVVATCSSGVVYQLDLENQTGKKIKVGKQDIRGISLNPLNSEIALGSSDQHIYWLPFSDPNSGVKSWKAHESTVFALQYYPSGHQLVSAGRDAKLNLWAEVNPGKFELEKAVPAHLFGIHDVVLHPSKPILATCSMDKTIKIWDAETLKLLRVLDKARHAGHGHAVNQLLWLKDQEVLLSCSDDRTISAWNIFE